MTNELPPGITSLATHGEPSAFTAPHRDALHQPSSMVHVTSGPGTGRRDASAAPLIVSPILVIDDSLTVRKIMEVTHRRQGFALRAFADGVEALQWLHAYPTMIPSLVYLDICLPRMDGYDVARTLHSKPHLAAVPIVMLTGRDGVLDRLKGRLAGARGYITKPFRGEEILIETLRYTSHPASETARGDQHGGAKPMYGVVPRF